MTIAPSSWESDHAGGTVSVGEMVEIVSFLSLYILTPDGVPRMTASDQSYCRMRRQLVEEREDLAMPYPRPYALRPFTGRSHRASGRDTSIASMASPPQIGYRLQAPTP
ncbi:hypothetical protein ACFQU2_36995 [Siccirubricoccus deserti]